jgi:hypothetical protein
MKKSMVILTRREFYGDEHWKFCVEQYDKARNFLKSCGKPKDWYDKWLIQEARFTASFYASCLREIEI